MHAAQKKIATFDRVELTDAIEAAPAGSRGTVVDTLDGDVVMVEITTMPLEPLLDRIVAGPISKLRRIGHVRTDPDHLAA